MENDEDYDAVESEQSSPDALMNFKANKKRITSFLFLDGVIDMPHNTEFLKKR